MLAVFRHSRLRTMTLSFRVRRLFLLKEFYCNILTTFRVTVHVIGCWPALHTRFACLQPPQSENDTGRDPARNPEGTSTRCQSQTSREGKLQLPLEISEFSPTPPHSDSVTSGRSPAESDRHSVPLSAAALPTDWGDWDPERCPVSTQCLLTCSDSLKQECRFRH